MLKLKIESPATVLEGTSYLTPLVVTNRSTKVGVPVGATLGVGISSSVDSLVLIPEQVADEYFAPNETRDFNYTLVAPSGSGGQSGTIIAWIQDPTGKVLAHATENVFIEALPPPVKYTLEVTIEPPGTGRVSIEPYRTEYSAGERVTLTAYPDPGYEFDHWGGWDGATGTSTAITITMDRDRWVVAAFREVEAPPEPTTYTVRVRTGTPGGTVSKSPNKASYSYGEYVKVTAYPYMDFEFGAWQIDGAWSTSNPKTIRVTEDIVATAYFEPAYEHVDHSDHNDHDDSPYNDNPHADWEDTYPDDYNDWPHDDSPHDDHDNHDDSH